jgi:PTH1 family peptidyl-tRNA hydrolase
MNDRLFSANQMFLIVGLGNPGRQYKNNRHNVGFMFIDSLTSHLNTTINRMESKALIAKSDYLNQRLIIAKPQTFMNLSGQAVGSLARFYKVPLENLLVAYDDIDLPFGSLRLRSDGGSGGHNGMKSIIERLGQSNFPRLRIGVSRPPGSMEAADYVLQDFTVKEKEELAWLLDRAVDAALCYISQGIDQAMNQYNSIGSDGEPSLSIKSFIY